MDSEMEQYIRIMKGEIGPDASQEEANKMAQTIYNRVRHPDIKSKLTNDNEYHTLKYSKQDYQLSPSQRALFEAAYNQRAAGQFKTVGWATTPTLIPSNKYYIWEAETYMTGRHYYYHAKARSS